VHIATIAPVIEPDNLARYLGVRKGKKLTPSVTRSIDTWNERINGLMEPQVAYVMRRIVTVEPGGVRIEDGVYFKSPKIARTLKECSTVVCFVATIDDGVEHQVKALMKRRRTSEAYVLDSMGSVAVENMVDRFHLRMEKRYKKEGKSVTLRFSPGYCDWNIREQKKLFSLFDEEKVNVALHDNSCIMAPRKSVSGLFGVLPFDRGGTIATYNPCTDCGKRDCIARRSESDTAHKEA
jgi:hypothetical protein